MKHTICEEDISELLSPKFDEEIVVTVSRQFEERIVYALRRLLNQADFSLTFPQEKTAGGNMQ